MANVTININATDEQLKAVDGIVVDYQTWLQTAWDGKVASCRKKVILEESDKNPAKMDEATQITWITNNTFLTRVQKDAL